MRADGVAYSTPRAAHSRRPIEQQPYDPVAAVKGRYKHFMLKEIHEQPDAALDARPRPLPRRAAPRVELEGVPFTAERGAQRSRASCSSAWAPRCTRRWSDGTTSSASRASPPRSTTPPSSATASPCSTSTRWSSPWRSRARRSTRLPRWTRHGEPAARRSRSATRRAPQTTRIADGTIYMRAGPEIAVASTKTMVGSMVALHALALHLGRMRGVARRRGGARAGRVCAAPAHRLGDALLLEPQIEALAADYADVRGLLLPRPRPVATRWPWRARSS